MLGGVVLLPLRERADPKGRPQLSKLIDLRTSVIRERGCSPHPITRAPKGRSLLVHPQSYCAQARAVDPSRRANRKFANPSPWGTGSNLFKRDSLDVRSHHTKFTKKENSVGC